MGKWKTQEAAFPTFPQGPLRDKQRPTNRDQRLDGGTACGRRRPTTICLRGRGEFQVIKGGKFGRLLTASLAAEKSMRGE